MKVFLVFIGFASLQYWSPFVLPGMKILLFQYERHREIACCLLSATIFWKRLIHREFRLQRCLLFSLISEQCKVLFYRQYCIVNSCSVFAFLWRPNDTVRNVFLWFNGVIVWFFMNVISQVSLHLQLFVERSLFTRAVL